MTAEPRDDFGRLVQAKAILHARLAAADRENAELRGEVERLRALPVWTGQWVQESIADQWKAERNSARAQLAAAQAQLAEEIAWRNRLTARLEAVRVVLRNADGDGRPGMVILAAQIVAALSAAPQSSACDHGLLGKACVSAFNGSAEHCPGRPAAPQPEPDLTPDGSPDDCDHGGGPATSCNWCTPPKPQPEPPASDEPARCEGFSWIGQSFAHCDACGKPYWEHTHVRQHRPGAKLFAADAETLVPITPGDAAQVRAQWGPR